MEWADIWKIVLCAVGSAGGIGTIIVLVIKFSANTIAERLSKKYEAKLQKELEKYKSLIDEKTYISKVQFDTEFEVYRNVSGALFDVVKVFNTAFSPDYSIGFPLNASNVNEELKRFMSVAEKLQNAQDEFCRKSAFIPTDLYEKYDKIIEEAQTLFWEYKEALEKEATQSIYRTDEWMKEKHQQIDKLDEKRKQINNELRIYLRSLIVVQ